ncbi:MAG TPA: hypothetical protein PL041_01635, partial [Melioribacteraceae bacterium]|nr:hypothetical protein [Melioribacteraceae bacterium]
MQYVVFFISLIILIGCNTVKQENLRFKAIEEIKKTEKEFEAYVKQYGITEGFYKFADDNAVLNHSENLIKGNVAKFEGTIQTG